MELMEGKRGGKRRAGASRRVWEREEVNVMSAIRTRGNDGCSGRDRTDTGISHIDPHQAEPLNITTSSSVHFDDRPDISKLLLFRALKNRLRGVSL